MSTPQQSTSDASRPPTTSTSRSSSPAPTIPRTRPLPLDRTGSNRNVSLPPLPFVMGSALSRGSSNLGQGGQGGLINAKQGDEPTNLTGRGSGSSGNGNSGVIPVPPSLPQRPSVRVHGSIKGVVPTSTPSSSTSQLTSTPPKAPFDGSSSTPPTATTSTTASPSPYSALKRPMTYHSRTVPKYAFSAVTSATHDPNDMGVHPTHPNTQPTPTSSSSSATATTIPTTTTSTTTPRQIGNPSLHTLPPTTITGSLGTPDSLPVMTGPVSTSISIPPEEPGPRQIQIVGRYEDPTKDKEVGMPLPLPILLFYYSSLVLFAEYYIVPMIYCILLPFISPFTNILTLVIPFHFLVISPYLDMGQ